MTSISSFDSDLFKPKAAPALTGGYDATEWPQFVEAGGTSI